MQKYITKSPEDTKKIAVDLISKEKDFSRPIIFLLYGELGSGKTTFAKGIGEVLGVKKMVSPSFVINCEYPLKCKDKKNLIHFDFYNLKEEEYDLVGIEESLQPGNIIIIEWPENNDKLIDQMLKSSRVISIKFEHDTETTRRLFINY